ncbi:MAG: DUF4230 domain-containing protein [Myxococcales bacterium]|nr:DUF4230 domain-containing protein [Myxococcales bacterium]
MSESNRGRRSGGFVRTLLFLLLLGGALAYVIPWVYRSGDAFGYERGHAQGFREGYGNSKDARTIVQKGGGAALNLDVQAVVDGLSDLGQDPPSPRFVSALDRLYEALIERTGRAYPFEAGHAQRARTTWSQMKAPVIAANHDTLSGWQARRAPLPGSRMSLSHHTAASDLHTLLKDEACGVVREAFLTSVAPDEPRPVISGLCAFVDKELLAPWARELSEAALARDVSASVTAAETRHRKAIMELATAEVQVQGRVRHDYESKVFEGWPIESTDVATLEVRGTGIVKSGFKMHESYEVTVLHDEHLIRVALPRAEVLSNTLVPEFSQEKEGWWTSLTSAQRNQAIAALQKQVEAQALKDGLLAQAEERAEGLVQDLYSPVTALPGSQYRVEVVFAGQAPVE